MTEQQTNNIDRQSLDPDDFVTIGDYWKAWIELPVRKGTIVRCEVGFAYEQQMPAIALTS